MLPPSAVTPDRTTAAPGLATVAHALAGPLISARAGLARAGERHPADPDLAAAAAALARAQRVADGLARLAAAERPCLPVDVPLGDALRVALRRVALDGPPAQIQAGALPAVHADEDHLVALLFELIANTARHAGGARLRVSATSDGDAVTVVLEDDGPGLPAAVMAGGPRPFCAGDGAGAGCGLAVAAALAAANGGRLALEEAAGARVVLRLPAAGAAS